jgi:hypothetical protein
MCLNGIASLLDRKVLLPGTNFGRPVFAYMRVLQSPRTHPNKTSSQPPPISSPSLSLKLLPPLSPLDETREALVSVPPSPSSQPTYCNQWLKSCQRDSTHATPPPDVSWPGGAWSSVDSKPMASFPSLLPLDFVLSLESIGMGGIAAELPHGGGCNSFLQVTKFLDQPRWTRTMYHAYFLAWGFLLWHRLQSDGQLSVRLDLGLCLVLGVLWGGWHRCGICPRGRLQLKCSSDQRP